MSVLSRRVALCMFIAFPLAAQEPAPADSAAAKKPTKVGFGVILSPIALFVDDAIGFMPIGFGNFLVPIRIGPNAMIEPEFGLLRSSSDAGTSDFSNWRLGVGVLAGLKERAGLKPYVGPRIGFGRSSSDFGGSEVKQNMWWFSAVFGAQHFFSEHFSLGGEVQLTRLSVGDPDVTPAPPFPVPSESQSFVSTGGVVMLRWFF